MQNSAPLLSVVVAVYNGEAFLDQFFTCLVNQHIDSMEVIIVNDGSTDRSMQIVENGAKSCHRCRLLNNLIRACPSRVIPARRLRPGSISFPDIDDVFKPGMYQRLLDMAVKQNPDVATCNGNYVWENNKTVSPYLP